jgi:hypothetical protein
MRVFVMLLLAFMLVLNVSFTATASQEEDAAYSNRDSDTEPREEVQPWDAEQERAEHEGEREEGDEAAEPAEEEEQDEEREEQEER